MEWALKFDEGEIIEFVGAKAVDNGWLRGRAKGGNGRWGLVPVEYLDLKIEDNGPDIVVEDEHHEGENAS